MIVTELSVRFINELSDTIKELLFNVFPIGVVGVGVSPVPSFLQAMKNEIEKEKRRSTGNSRECIDFIKYKLVRCYFMQGGGRNNKIKMVYGGETKLSL